MSLFRILSYVRRRWWLLIASSVVCLGLAWYMTPVTQIRYEARTVVRLTDSKRAVTGNLAGPQPEDLSSDFIESQVAVIRSRALAGEVVEREGLRLVPPTELRRGSLVNIAVDAEASADSLRLTFSEMGFTVASVDAQVSARYGLPVDISGVRFTLLARPGVEHAILHILPHDAAVDRLLAGLRAEPRLRSTVIDILYVDADPNRAKLIVNEVTRAFQEHNTRSVSEQSQRRRQFIEDQLTEMMGQLAEAGAALSSFRSHRSHQSSRNRQDGLMSLEVRREELDADRRMLRTLLMEVEGELEGTSDQAIRTLVSAPGIASNPVVTQLFNQYVQYETERKRLLADGRSPTSPDVERQTTLRWSTRAELVQAARSHVASLDARVAALDELRDRSAASLRELPQVETAEAQLVQEVESVRRTVDLLRDEYQRARIAEAVEIGQVAILDLATFAIPVGRASGRQRLVISVVLGLMLGAGGAVAAEMVNSSVRRREELEELLQLPGLAVIPRISDGKRQWIRMKALPIGPRRGAGKNVQQLVGRDEASASGAEAYRVLRNNLVFSDQTKRLGILAVTSAASGEGKTTTAANLAITLARQGIRTLLVDCDLRRPQLHRVFGIDRDPGFVDLLLGRASAGQVARVSGVEGLSVVPRGRFDAEAVEMLGSERMRSCLAELAREYDMIILDTPPVLVAADAPAVGAVSEGVLLVIRAGRTKRESVQAALQQLGGVGGRVIGSVLNDPDCNVEGYREYYKYQYTAEV